MQREYHEVDDPDGMPVPDDKLLKAFSYGKQLVPIPKDKEELIKLEETERHFTFLGFAPKDSIPRSHFMGGVDVVLPVKSEQNQRAFTAIVLAMLESDMVLMARFVSRKNADPKLVALFPHISNKKGILYMVELPTSEDVRDYSFPPLVQATNQQRKAAGEFIDALDLTKKDTEERLKPQMTYNPALQYF